jgi:hypothetical protein
MLLFKTVFHGAFHYRSVLLELELFSCELQTFMSCFVLIIAASLIRR